MLSILALLCQLGAVVASAVSPSLGDGANGGLLSLPLFRAPKQHEVESSPHGILWSAHESGDTRRMVPTASAVRLACLLEGIGANGSVPVQSLVWALVDEATGQETRHQLTGSDRVVSFAVGGMHLRGHYSEWIGSTLDASVPALSQSSMRIRCEYQLPGLQATISSSWLILWDERSEVRRLQTASLHCNRTVYQGHGDVRHPTPLAVTYTCLGVGDTRLLETAVVAVCVCSTEEAATCIGRTELSSNSSASGRDFFGFAFGGRVRLGWTVRGHGSGNDSALPGARLEQQLKTPGAKLFLKLLISLSRGGSLTLAFSISEVTVLQPVFISPEEPLLVSIMDGSGQTEVQLDWLLDPPDRALPCPVLCLPDSTALCQHQWVGPGGAEPSRPPPMSQPLSLSLRTFDSGSVGVWSCNVRMHFASIAYLYVVTVRPRPMVCGPRFPRHSVVFSPGRLSVNCSLCGLTTNARLEFDVIAASRAVNYSVERTMELRARGSAWLSLSFSEVSPTSGGATIVLRCLAVEPNGGRTVADFAAVYLLPVPDMKPLNVCQVADSTCRVDCRSPLASRLRSLGVSVSYQFSLYDISNQLYKVLYNSSGVLEDARNATGAVAPGEIRSECRQLFYYSDGRDGLSPFQTLVVTSGQAKDSGPRIPSEEQRYDHVSLPPPKETQQVSTLPTPHVTTIQGPTHNPMSIILYTLIGFAAFGVLIFCMVIGIRIREDSHHPRRNIKPSFASMKAKHPIYSGGLPNSTRPTAPSAAGGPQALQQPLVGMGAARPQRQPTASARPPPSSQVPQQQLPQQLQQIPEPTQQEYRRPEKQQQQLQAMQQQEQTEPQPLNEKTQQKQSQQQKGDQRNKNKAFSTDLEVNIDKASPSARSAGVGASEGFPANAHSCGNNEGQSTTRTESASADSAAETPDIQSGEKVVVGWRSQRHGSADFPFSWRARDRSASSRSPLAQSASDPRSYSHSSSSPGPLSQSPSSAALVGFDFCLKGDSSDQEPHTGCPD